MALHLTGCELAEIEPRVRTEPSFVMTNEGHFPPVHESHQMLVVEFASAQICAACRGTTVETLLGPCADVFNPESWRNGEIYMYQEPEPVHLWPNPTLTARQKAAAGAVCKIRYSGDSDGCECATVNDRGCGCETIAIAALAAADGVSTPPTQWGKLTARVRIWYRRVIGTWRLP